MLHSSRGPLCSGASSSRWVCMTHVCMMNHDRDSHIYLFRRRFIDCLGMQAGLILLAGTAGQVVVSSTITPIVKNTISLITSLRTIHNTPTLQDVIVKHDIPATLQTIESTCVALKCNAEPLKTAAGHVVQAVQHIHQLLTRIADITAAHNAGVISRWRTLVLDSEISQLESLMSILHQRFKLMCDIHSVTS